MLHWNTSANIEAATSRKAEMYKELTTTIQGNDFKCLNIPLEIGTRGFINARNKNILTQLCHSLRITKVSKVVKNCSKLAVLGVVLHLEGELLFWLEWGRSLETLKSNHSQ